MMEFIIIVAIIVGFINGFSKTNEDSFWKGFGEGLAGKPPAKNYPMYISYRDRKTGIGFSNRIK